MSYDDNMALISIQAIGALWAIYLFFKNIRSHSIGLSIVTGIIAIGWITLIIVSIDTFVK
jgi:hypothetical protein